MNTLNGLISIPFQPRVVDARAAPAARREPPATRHTETIADRIAPDHNERGLGYQQRMSVVPFALLRAVRRQWDHPSRQTSVKTNFLYHAAK